MNRYKQQGWFGESYRHYLAAKGVKTIQIGRPPRPDDVSFRIHTPTRDDLPKLPDMPEFRRPVLKIQPDRSAQDKLAATFVDEYDPSASRDPIGKAASATWDFAQSLPGRQEAADEWLRERQSVTGEWLKTYPERREAAKEATYAHDIQALMEGRVSGKFAKPEADLSLYPGFQVKPDFDEVPLHSDDYAIKDWEEPLKPFVEPKKTQLDFIREDPVPDSFKPYERPKTAAQLVKEETILVTPELLDRESDVEWNIQALKSQKVRTARDSRRDVQRAALASIGRMPASSIPESQRKALERFKQQRGGGF